MDILGNQKSALQEKSLATQKFSGSFSFTPASLLLTVRVAGDMYDSCTGHNAITAREEDLGRTVCVYTGILWWSCCDL